MTLTQLAYIVALADQGHFGRAAETCFVSQPTLSVQIRKLEEELGVTLFDRTLQPVRPTGRGEDVVAQARVILAERDRMFSLLDAGGPVAGELRIGVIPTLANYLLPIAAPQLKEAYPGIELSVEELTTTHLLDRLAAGRLDAGLVATEVGRPGVETVTLFDEAFVGYLNGDHTLIETDRLRPEDIDTANLWLLADGHCLRDQVMQLCKRSHEPPDFGIRFESGSLETLRYLVDTVGGMTLLPLLATHYLDAEASRKIRRFHPPVPNRNVRLARPRAGVKHRLVSALVDVVKTTVPPILEAAQ